jgi:hypothetical protein
MEQQENNQTQEALVSAEELQNATTAVSTTTPLTNTAPSGMSKRQLNRMRKNQKSQKRAIEVAMANYAGSLRRIENELKALETTIGIEDFKMLKEICTVVTPEVKNEQGEVTQAASKRLNKEALIVEAKNLIVLKRESRIEAGIRSRSSGRGSSRKAHSSSLKFILARNQTAAQEAATATVEANVTSEQP